jgi:hypothetical protein
MAVDRVAGVNEDAMAGRRPNGASLQEWMSARQRRLEP